MSFEFLTEIWVLSDIDVYLKYESKDKLQLYLTELTHL